MAVFWSYQDTVHIRYDDVARTVQEYEPGGIVLIQERPFNTAETTIADAAALVATHETNRLAILALLGDALASLQVIIDDTNSNINSNPAARIKDIARVLRRLIRLAVQNLDGTA